MDIWWTWWKEKAKIENESDHSLGAELISALVRLFFVEWTSQSSSWRNWGHQTRQKKVQLTTTPLQAPQRDTHRSPHYRQRWLFWAGYQPSNLNRFELRKNFYIYFWKPSSICGTAVPQKYSIEKYWPNWVQNPFDYCHICGTTVPRFQARMLAGPTNVPDSSLGGEIIVHR